MPISDDDLVKFYQNVLAYLAVEGDDYLHSMAGWETSLEWHQKALDAVARLSSSNLLSFGENVSRQQALKALAENGSSEVSDVWVQYFLYPTTSGLKLAQEFELDVDATVIVPGFREALSRVFDEHGVGFDVELPYKMRFPG